MPRVSHLTDQTIRPHQVVGARFLAERPFAILADEAGAGKTLALIHAADLVKAKRVGVFCPAAVRPHWARQFAQWQTVRRAIHLIDGAPTQPLADNAVTIMSHATLVKPQAYQLLSQTGADAFIIDEGGEFRAFDAARVRHLYNPAPSRNPVEPPGLWARAPYTWHATGTPVTNSAGDLYPLWAGPLARTTPKGFVDWYDFCNHFTDLKPNGLNGLKPTGVRHVEELRQLLRPHLLRREFDLGLALTIEAAPQPVTPAELTEAIATLEGWTVEQVQALIASGQEPPQDSAISRVRRALGRALVPHAARFLHDLLQRGAGPIVAFFHHQDVKQALYRALSPRWRISWIDGTVTRKQLEAAELWYQAGHIDLLLVQTQAGGMGLTLVRGNIVVVVELPWTAAALWQAIKRVHRFGQTQPCWAAILTCDFWLMNVLLSVLSQKKTMSQTLLDPLTERVQ